jgi:chromosome segregation ATPase
MVRPLKKPEEYHKHMSKDLRNTFGTGDGLDEKSLDFLTRALSQKNLPDFDYMEFRQSVSNLRKLNMDDPTAFRSAFATATTLGVTRERLEETARFYKGVLQEEKQKFEVALRHRLEQEVSTKEAEAEMLRTRVAEYRQKIEQLEAQISADEQALSASESAIAEEKERITTRKAEFERTHSTILDAIDQDIEHIQMYL